MYIPVTRLFFWGEERGNVFETVSNDLKRWVRAPNFIDIMICMVKSLARLVVRPLIL